jgi:hypothetical protein
MRNRRFEWPAQPTRLGSYLGRVERLLSEIQAAKYSSLQDPKNK